MTENELPDVPIAIVQRLGQEPEVTMPLSAWLRLLALARQAVERPSAGQMAPLKRDIEGFREITSEEARRMIRADIEAALRKVTNDFEPLREALVKLFEVTVPDEDYEALADVAALEEARRRDEETVPHALVKRLISGDHPMKVFREHRGLTQAQLAERTGLSAMYLSQIETGRRGGSTKTLRKIARALGVDLDDLARWKDDDDAGSESPRARPVRRAG